MTNCQGEMKRAVDCGYWNLFRYDPSAEKPFALDSKEPADGYRDLLMNEARYARLTNEFPDRAEELFAKSEANAKKRYEHLLKLKQALRRGIIFPTHAGGADFQSPPVCAFCANRHAPF